MASTKSLSSVSAQFRYIGIIIKLRCRFRRRERARAGHSPAIVNGLSFGAGLLVQFSLETVISSTCGRRHATRVAEDSRTSFFLSFFLSSLLSYLERNSNLACARSLSLSLIPLTIWVGGLEDGGRVEIRRRFHSSTWPHVLLLLPSLSCKARTNQTSRCRVRGVGACIDKSAILYRCEGFWG